MAVIKQLKDCNGSQQIFPKTTTQAVYNPDGTPLQSTLNEIYGDIATIETSPAVSSHEVGAYVVYNGQLYKVTAAISAGENLVVGTNISLTTVGGELSSINSNSVWSKVEVNQYGTDRTTNYNNPGITYTNPIISNYNEFCVQTSAGQVYLNLSDRINESTMISQFTIESWGYALQVRIDKSTNSITVSGPFVGSDWLSAAGIGLIYFLYR